MVFHCAWEYPVVDHAAEVAFHTEVMGMTTVADDGEYALFTTAGTGIHYACRRHPGPQPELGPHRLTLMTRDIERFAAELAARTAVRRFAGSAVQTVLHVVTPAGLDVHVWEFPEAVD